MRLSCGTSGAEWGSRAVRYEIQALTSAAQLRRLTVDAASPEQARRQAGLQGLQVLAIRELAPPRRARRVRGAARSGFSLLLFSRQMVALIRAGLTVVEAIEALAENQAQTGGSAVLSGVLAALQEGLSFSAALGRHPESFPEYFVAAVRAAERTGDLAEALSRWSRYQERIDAARKEIRNALIYPTVLTVAGLAVVLLLLLYVVPRFAGVYSGREGDLPWLSRLLVEWGRLAAGNVELALVGLLVPFALVAAAVRTAAFRRWLWRRLWGNRLVGDRLRQYYLARFYRTLGMLLRSGMPVADALSMVPGIVAPNLREQVGFAATLIREGRSIPDALRSAELVTPVADHLLRVGDRTGGMDEMAEHIADFLDEENARAISAAVRLFEPAIMALIGLVVGAIVVLMYIPIFELAGGIGTR